MLAYSCKESIRRRIKRSVRKTVEKEDITNLVKLTRETISNQIISPKINKTKIKLFVQVIIV